MRICPLYVCSLFDEEATVSKWDPKLLHWNARALPAQWMDWHLERIFQLFAAIFQGLATCGHIFRGLAKSGIYFNVYNAGFLLFLARPQHICLTNKIMITPWWWCCKQNLCLSLGRGKHDKIGNFYAEPTPLHEKAFRHHDQRRKLWCWYLEKKDDN